MNWDFIGLVKALRHHPKQGNSPSKLFTTKADTEAQFAEALAAALSSDKADHLTFIEVVLDTDDVSGELLLWGANVAELNSRKPNPQ